MLNRIEDWRKFSLQIEKHIEQYTIPQYQSEDNLTDQVNIWTSEDCIKAISRYIVRFKSHIRGKQESLRDLLKIAHYAQFAYDKLKKELDEGDVYE